MARTCYNKYTKGKEKASNTRKGYTMMTYNSALNIAIDSLSTSNPDVAERLTTLRDTLAKRSGSRSDESKAKASAKRKEATAKARLELCAQIIPILRETITTDMTAKEIFEAAKARLPEDFTAPKVQNILIREMAPELVKTETKGKPNTYRRA